MNNKAQMQTVWIVLIVIGVIALLGILTMVALYNGIITRDADAEKAWGNVETAYQRRADLIPNLVNTVKGIADFEKSTYLAVTEARTKWLSAGTPNEKIAAGQQLDSALSRLLVTVENYPDLKANQNFLALQDELAGTENRIKFERDNYNNAVKNYKLTTRRFPSSMVAGMFGFDKDKWSMFAAKEGAEDPVDVEFDFE